MTRVKTDTTNLCRLVARYPSTLLYPLCVLAVVIGVGVWGITRVAHAEADTSKSRAGTLALEVASSFRQQLTSASSPLLSLAALVHYNPQYAFLDEIFPSFAADLAAQVARGALRSLQLAPLGVVRLVYPLAGNTAALGLDLFGVATERDGAVKTVNDRVITLVGPMAFKQVGYGVRVRLPIFAGSNASSTASSTANYPAFVTVATANGSVLSVPARPPFGGPDALNPYCGAPCAPDPATGEVFWGFATVLIDLAALASSSDSRLEELSNAGYVYRLSAPAAPLALRLIAASGGASPGPDAVAVPIQLPNNQWLLEVSPASGDWVPDWYSPLLAGVVLLAAALAAVLFAALVSRRQHQMLLEALLPRELIRDLVTRDAASMGPRILQPDTPADVLLKLLGCLLGGEPPDLRDVLLLRTTVARHADFYSPLNLGGHLRDANLDDDVARALMRQLGGIADSADFLYDDLPEDAEEQMRMAFGPDSPDGGGAAGADADDAAPHEYDTLSAALGLILTPQPASWYDSVGCDGAACDAALPAAGTECSLPSPSPSLASCAAAMSSATFAAANGGSFGGGANSPQPALAALMRSRQQSMSAAAMTSAAAAALAERPSPRRMSRELSNASTALPPPPAAVAAAVAALQRGSVNGMMPPASVAVNIVASGGGAGGAAGSANLFLLPSRPATQPGVHSSGVAQNAPGGDDGGGRLTPPHSGGADTALDAAIGAVGFNGYSGRLSAPNHPSAEVSPSQLLTGSGASVRTSAVPPPTAFAAPGSPASRSPLGLFRYKQPRLPQASAGGGGPPPPPQLTPPQSALYGGAGADGGGGGGGAAALSLSATFSGNLGQICNTLPEDRPSSRFFASGAANGAGSGVLSSGVNGCGNGNGGGGGGGAMAAAALRRRCMPPPAAVIQEVERLLARADSWQFDTWGLQVASGGHALSCLGYYLIQRSGLLARFRINPVTMARLLRHIEAGYVSDNPYHNAVHAADVLQTLHAILHGGLLHVHYLDQLGLLAAYFAAIIHDYGHPGVTNDFLIATSDPLALRYNDRSPLENHHAASAFCVLRRPELDVTAGLSVAERSAFRKLVIDLVLATDMKQHFAVLGHFNTVHRLAGFAAGAAVSGKGGGGGDGLTRSLTHKSSRNLSLLEPGVVNTARPDASDLAPRPKDDVERLLGLQVAMKAADLGHLGEELAVHKRWLAGLEEEFFRQGDRERELGLPISPLFDRAKQGVSKSQVGFYDFVALPLVHALSSAFPGCAPLMKCFVSNYNHWRRVEAAGSQPLARSDSDAGGGGGADGPAATTGGGAGRTQNGTSRAAATATVAHPPPPPPPQEP